MACPRQKPPLPASAPEELRRRLEQEEQELRERAETQRRQMAEDGVWLSSENQLVSDEQGAGRPASTAAAARVWLLSDGTAQSCLWLRAAQLLMDGFCSVPYGIDD